MNGSEEEQIGEVVSEPAAEVVAEPVVEPVIVVVPEKKQHIYQPLDDLGRPMGGKQVLEYTTQEELVEKLQEQNVLILRRLRAETRKNRLGVRDEEMIAEDAPRYTEPVDFTKPALTPDQRVKLARELNIDPERLDETTDALFESAVGVRPEVLRQTLKQLQDDNAAAKAGQEANIFVAANPDYYKCNENLEAINGWLISKNLAPVRENFQRAYDTLKAAGVIVYDKIQESVQIPAVAEPTPTSAAAEPVVEAEPVSSPVRIATGLTRGQATDAVGVRLSGDDIVYEYQPTDSLGHPNGPKKVFRGAAALNAMPADEYRRRVNTVPGFVKKAEKAEAEAEAKRRARV